VRSGGRDASLPSSALGKAANYTLSALAEAYALPEYPELEAEQTNLRRLDAPVALVGKTGST